MLRNRGKPVTVELIRRLGFHSEEMALAVILWLCTLPLVALVIIPVLGVQAGIVAALSLLVGAMAICWGLCGWKIFRR
jgi:hypothetical protein